MSGVRWELPGPARMIDSLCADAYRDRVAAVVAPVDAGGLADAIEGRLNNDGQVRVVAVRPGLGDSALDLIAREAGVDRSNPAALVTTPALADCAIVVLAGAETVAPALDDFARLAARSRTGSEPILMVVGNGALPLIGGKTAREAKGLIGPLDAAGHLARLRLQLPPLEALVITSVAIETACWDVETAERIATLPVARAVRPDLCPEAWTGERLPSWRGVPASWAAGSSDEWNGDLCEHASWLAANRPDALSKRVWRGQVAALLPWIETRRLEIVAVFSRVLTPDRERCGPDIESLDWGPLRHQLRRQAQWLLQFVEQARLARNELAHGRPLDWPQIVALLSGSRRWSSGRGAPQVVR